MLHICAEITAFTVLCLVWFSSARTLDDVPCLPGWIGITDVTGCYQFADHACIGGCTWPEAVEYCKKLDSNLIEINTLEEFNAINRVLTTKNKGLKWWVGASDRRTEGTWLWENSLSTLPITSPMWEEMSPNTRKENAKDCAFINEDGMKLNDGNCNQKEIHKEYFYQMIDVASFDFEHFYPICQKK